VSLIILPLTNVLISLAISPDSLTLHRSILEIPIIILVIVLQRALTMCPIVLKVTYIDRTIGKFLIALSTLEVKTKFALINCILCLEDTKTMLHASIYPSKIQVASFINDFIALL
jgi:hypothetical protein